MCYYIPLIHFSDQQIFRSTHHICVRNNQSVISPIISILGKTDIVIFPNLISVRIKKFIFPVTSEQQTNENAFSSLHIIDSMKQACH